MPIDPYDDIQQFERWFLGFASRPTVTSMVIVFIALAAVTWFGRPWTPSTRAWFAFACANAATWLYFREAARLSEEWQFHVRLVIVWWLWLSGAWFGWTLFARFVRGAEDESPMESTPMEPTPAGEDAILYDGPNRRNGPPDRRGIRP